MATKYKHAEAFCLLWYACRDCGHLERIWNSRDGVTPFGTSCPSCGKMLHHEFWDLDVLAPEHKLHRGQRFFRDGTPEEAVAIVERRLKVAEQVGTPVPPEYVTIMRKEAKDGDLMGEFPKGWPYLDRSP